MQILHLSDIHFGRNDPEYGIQDQFRDHYKILQGLIDQITALEESQRPEHILFTGDIAWCGKTTEFAEALQWFRHLLDSLGLTGKDISFCVGNHDLDRDCCFTKCDINDNAIARIDDYYRYENNAMFEASILNYDTFCEQLGVIPYRYPTAEGWKYSYSVGYKDVTFQNGLTMRVVAMNTSLLLQQKGITRDKMWLGRPQVTQLMDYGLLPAPKEEIWCTTVLFHHPERFLNINEICTYNDRSPTLYMLLEYADLLLCGHTESVGRPGFLRQLGGGMMLVGGATYYSDTHRNSFSMLYVSDTRRGAIAFLPYQYKKGAWQGYDLIAPMYQPAEQKQLPAESHRISPMVLQLENASGSFSIPFRKLLMASADKESGLTLHIDSAADFMNIFTLRYDGPADGSGALVLGVSPSWSRRTDALARYNELSDFLSQGAVSRWSLSSEEDGDFLRGTLPPDCSLVLQSVFEDRELLHTLRAITLCFEVPVFVPEQITEKDVRRIHTLKELAMTDRTEDVSTPAVLKLQCGKEDLESLAAYAGQPFFVRRTIAYTTELFGITIRFGKVSVFSGPYLLDAEDLHQKLESFLPGDLRTAVFTALPGHQACILRGEKAEDPVTQGYPIYDTDALEFLLDGEE